MQIQNRWSGASPAWLGVLVGVLLMSSCSLTQSNFKLADHSAQRTNIDSLTQTCWEERVDNAGLARILGQEALETSRGIDYSTGIGRSCKCLASIAYAERAYGAADSLLTQALAVLEAKSEPPLTTEQRELVGQIYLQMGNVKLRKDSREAGLQWYLRGADYASEHQLSSLGFSFDLAIARQKGATKQYPAADSLFRQLILRQEVADRPAHQRGNVYYSYATFLARSKKYEAALQWLEKARDTFRDLPGYQRYYAMTLNALVNLEQRRGQVAKAEDYLRQCLNIKTQVTRGQSNDLSYEYHSLGNVYLRKEDWANSEAFFTRATKIAEEAKDHKLLTKTHLGLSQLHARQRRWELAHEHLKASYAQRDSFISIQRAAALSSLLSQHEKKVAEEEAARSKVQAVTLRQRIWLLLSLVVILGLGIFLFRQWTKYRQGQLEKEKEILQRENEILLKEDEIRANNAHVDGQEVERKRISEALHDSMGSKLAALRMNLEHFREHCENVLPQQGHLLLKNLSLVDEAIGYNQNLAYQLMPPTLLRLGLPAALLSLKDRMESEKLRIEVHIYGMEQRLPEKLELSLYRTVEELLKNIINHAGATEVSIELTEHGGQSFNLIVVDDGQGFEYDSQKTNLGMGLSNIKSRVEHFKGTFTIDSAIGAGTTVILDLPFPVAELATS